MLNERPLCIAEQHNYLGLVIVSKVSWCGHISKIINKLDSVSWALNRCCQLNIVKCCTVLELKFRYLIAVGEMHNKIHKINKILYSYLYVCKDTVYECKEHDHFKQIKIIHAMYGLTKPNTTFLYAYEHHTDNLRTSANVRDYFRANTSCQ